MAASLSILHSVAWFADAINCVEVDEINWQSQNGLGQKGHEFQPSAVSWLPASGSGCPG